jgi:retron-type reverse transcriptase
MSTIHKSYDELFSLDNIFYAWRLFRRGKYSKTDVMNFELHLEDNIFSLFLDLQNHTYKHSSYSHFQIFDNKKRDIYKAEVRDRLVHQIIYDYLVFLFEKEFISDSYASRLDKGQYKAINVFRYFVKLNDYDSRGCFVLKCDIRKYFDSIDQNILLNLIRKRVLNNEIFVVIEEIVCSYNFSEKSKGIPLGNITSQIFANIYLNELDRYVKKELKCRFYVRYNDDFVIINKSRLVLEKIRNKIIGFVGNELHLNIPLEKTSVRNIDWGIDFLGFTILPKAILLRNKTKNKIYVNISLKNIHSYFGILNHCNSYKLKTKLLSKMAICDDF